MLLASPAAKAEGKAERKRKKQRERGGRGRGRHRGIAEGKAKPGEEREREPEFWLLCLRRLPICVCTLYTMERNKESARERVRKQDKEREE